MLAKLKYLKEEEKALKDIEMMITEQVTRLKQEECYLKSLLRDPNHTVQDQSSLLLKSHKTNTKETEVVDDTAVNAVPLDDLQVLQSASHQHLHQNEAEDTEEEEDDDDEMEDGDCTGSQEEDGINSELLALVQQMQGVDSYGGGF